MAKEIAVVAQAGIPEDAIFSIRAGAVRKQAPLSTGKPFRFPKIGITESPIKLEILQPIGTAYVVVKPGCESYQAIFQGKRAEGMACEVEIRTPEGEEQIDHEAAAEETSQTSKDAKAYLETHSILSFVQAVLQTVIKERPADPYAHIARHFSCGYDHATSTTMSAMPGAASRMGEALAADETLRPTAPSLPTPMEQTREQAQVTPKATPVAARPGSNVAAEALTPGGANPAPATPPAAHALPPALSVATNAAPETPARGDPAHAAAPLVAGRVPATPGSALAAAVASYTACPRVAEVVPATPVHAASPLAASPEVFESLDEGFDLEADTAVAIRAKVKATLQQAHANGSLAARISARVGSKAASLSSQPPSAPAEPAPAEAPAVEEAITTLAQESVEGRVPSKLSHATTVEPVLADGAPEGAAVLTAQERAVETSAQEAVNTLAQESVEGRVPSKLSHATTMEPVLADGAPEGAAVLTAQERAVETLAQESAEGRVPSKMSFAAAAEAAPAAAEDAGAPEAGAQET